MRHTVLWMITAMLMAFAVTTCAAGVYTVVPSSAPDVVIRPSGTMYVLERTGVQLPEGRSELAFDFAAAGVEQDTVRLTHISSEDVKILERYRSPEAPGTVRWVLDCPSSRRVMVYLRYEPSGIEVSVSYDALLDPDEEALELTAYVTAQNTSSRDHESLQITTSTGARFATDLAAGANITQELTAYSPVSYDSSYVYDIAEYGEKVMKLVSFTPSADRSLCGGQLRFVTDARGLQQTIGKTKLPYTRPAEQVTLPVRASTDLSVTGGLVQSQQKSVKTDVYKKLALFDRHETFEYEVHNRSGESRILLLKVHNEDDWSVAAHSHDFEQTDAQTAVFSVPVASGATVPVSFTIITENLVP